MSLEAIRAQVERILASEAFTHSERLSRFLRFTVEQAIQGRGETIKEYPVGVEVFDRGESYDPRTDPIVRVEAGRLRSKLREYYDTRGRDDPIRIGFQKGSYIPTFAPGGEPPSEAGRSRLWVLAQRNWRNRALLGALLLAAIASYWAASLTQENRRFQRELDAARPPAVQKALSAVWGRFFSSDVETFVVFGSPVFFAGQEGSDLFLRVSSLNEPANLLSDPNLQALQKRLGPLSGPRYDYAMMGDAIALQRLTAFLARDGLRLTATPAHAAGWESIKEGNIIFLGAPRTIPFLKSLPVQRDFDWDADQNIVNRRPQPGEQPLYATPSHRDQMTYAIIASFPGLRPNREILLLTAHSAPGVLAAVDYVTRPDSVRVMIDKLGLPDSGQHYEMLLRVFVDKGSPVKSEYVTHHVTSRSQP